MKKPDRVEALADIDEVLAYNPGTGGTGAAAAVVMLRLNCVLRHASASSFYGKQVEQVDKMVLLDAGKASQITWGLLTSLRSDVDRGKLTQFEEVVHADLFADLLTQADYLLSESYRRAAAVVAGGTLEEHLRNLGESVSSM